MAKSLGPDPAEQRGRFAELASLVVAAAAGGALAFGLTMAVLPTGQLPDDITLLIWYAIRVVGVVAYLLLWLTTVAGLCISVGVGGTWLPGAVLYPVHQLGDLALPLAALHAALLLGDHFAGFTPASLVIPFVAGYRPFWTGLGILALYLSAIVYWSVELRPRIGYRAWHRIHYASFVAYLFALVHGFAVGTDSATAPLRITFLVTGQVVVLLVAWRLLKALSPVTADAVAPRRNVR